MNGYIGFVRCSDPSELLDRAIRLEELGAWVSSDQCLEEAVRQESNK